MYTIRKRKSLHHLTLVNIGHGHRFIQVSWAQFHNQGFTLILISANQILNDSLF